jgi:hypothetical protein
MPRRPPDAVPPQHLGRALTGAWHRARAHGTLLAGLTPVERRQLDRLLAKLQRAAETTGD